MSSWEFTRVSTCKTYSHLIQLWHQINVMLCWAPMLAIGSFLVNPSLELTMWCWIIRLWKLQSLIRTRINIRPLLTSGRILEHPLVQQSPCTTNGLTQAKCTLAPLFRATQSRISCSTRPSNKWPTSQPTLSPLSAGTTSTTHPLMFKSTPPLSPSPTSAAGQAPTPPTTTPCAWTPPRSPAASTLASQV